MDDSTLPYKPSEPTRRGMGPVLLVTAASLLLVALQGPLAQDPSYHRFADQRVLAGIPSALNVLTNLAFVVAAVLFFSGRFSRGRRARESCWSLFALAVAGVGLGSGWYHLDPGNASLVWDRLPMAVAFMALLSAVVRERWGKRAGGVALVLTLPLAFASILWWVATGDLRLYAWVQFAPLVLIPLILAFSEARVHRWCLYGSALVLYLAAKSAEHFDAQVYEVTARTLSGHSLKHLLAAAAVCLLLRFGPSR